MPEPLWKIRLRKGMSVNQLARKSGVPAISITEYESGLAIRSADLPRLAKALYVEEWDIEIRGEAISKTEMPDEQAPPAAPRKPKEKKPAAEKTRRPPAPARPTQIEHLLTLTRGQFDKDRDALEEELAKPLEELTRNEASELLHDYQRLLAESRASEELEESAAKRKRAYLPEGVDEFELHYLTAQQESGALVHFTLFDGQQMSGRIIGFGPYSITIRDEKTNEEVTLQKLAIAYYRLSGDATPTAENSASNQHAGEES